MAQKRMFDKRVVESDKFTDLPNSSKALYFMAGMSADDKGFFQPRRLQKACGFADDDFKILIAKRFFIAFESGVMVVTDWNKNNWLDSRRITETEYVDELKLLKLVNEKYELITDSVNTAKPMLSENSIEENSIEENSILICSQPPKVGKTLSVYEQEFEELWKLYPKKTGKKDALKHYTVARKKGTTYEEVLKGIENYNQHIEQNHIEDRYIKGGSSWFCEELWNNEYNTEPKEVLPDWFDKDIEKQEISKEEQQEFDELLKSFG